MKKEYIFFTIFVIGLLIVSNTKEYFRGSGRSGRSGGRSSGGRGGGGRRGGQSGGRRSRRSGGRVGHGTRHGTRSPGPNRRSVGGSSYGGWFGYGYPFVWFRERRYACLSDFDCYPGVCLPNGFCSI